MTRDRTRRPHAKRSDLSRKAQRRAKSALQFLCIAFPPELAFGMGAPR